MPLLILLLLLPLIVIALMPLILVQRYRAGTARRLARPWLASLNAAVMLFSAIFFLIAAAATTVWVPNALTYSAIGMAIGAALGVIGVLITKWEATPRTLHYTPNRWIVLPITLVVAARVLYGFVRGWATMRAAAGDTSFVDAFGVAGSLGAGAIVIGYYLAYGIGLRRRISAWQGRALRVM
jgi:hypothetical protein